MELKKVMVIGAGQMGSGIAQVMAAHGVEVTLRDIKQEFVDRGLGTSKRNWPIVWLRAGSPKRTKRPLWHGSTAWWN